MRTFKAILLVAAFALSSADISLKLRENDFSHTNEQGGYHFGYNDGHLARHEERSPEGIVRGAYRYVDANGEVQTVSYTADSHNGFVASGSNIPKTETIQYPEKVEEVPWTGSVVDETPEIKAARIEHMQAYKEALRVLNLLPQPNIVQHQPQYTPEVAAARAEHINILNQERLRSQQQVIVPVGQYHPDYLPYAAL